MYLFGLEFYRNSCSHRSLVNKKATISIQVAIAKSLVALSMDGWNFSRFAKKKLVTIIINSYI